MDMIKYERLKTWAQEADEQKRSGMTQADWCRIHGVSIHTFKYRLKVLKKEADQLLQNDSESSKIQFAEIPAPILESKHQSSDTTPAAAVTIITDQMRIQRGTFHPPEESGKRDPSKACQIRDKKLDILTEQIRLANTRTFGRSSEKDVLKGQIELAFNEAETAKANNLKPQILQTPPTDDGVLLSRHGRFTVYWISACYYLHTDL